MKWTISSLLVPEELLVHLLVLAGILTILGVKRLASGLILFVISMAVLPVFEPFIEAIVAMLPDWALILVLAVVGLALLRVVAGLFLGQRASDQMVGTLAVYSDHRDHVFRYIVIGCSDDRDRSSEPTVIVLEFNLSS